MCNLYYYPTTFPHNPHHSSCVICTTIPLLFHTVLTTVEKCISLGELFCYLLTEVPVLCYQPLHYNHFHPTIIMKFLAAHLVTNSPCHNHNQCRCCTLCTFIFCCVCVCVWVLTYSLCFGLLQELLASQDGHCSMDLVYGSFFNCTVLLHIFWMWYTVMCYLPLRFSNLVECWTR